MSQETVKAPDRNDMDNWTTQQLLDTRDRIQDKIREINQEIARRLMSRQ